MATRYIVLCKLKKFLLFLLICIVLLTGCSASDVTLAPASKENYSEMQVHYLDVGQGDSTLIICGDEAMLIDAGDNSKGTAVQFYLQKQGIISLKYVIGTHPDGDHIGGLDVVLTKFDCDTVMMPDVEADTSAYRDVMDAMEYRNYRNTLPVVGDTYSLGDAVFTVIAPNRLDYLDINNCSIGIKLVHGENAFLFTGDAQEEAEEDILKNGIDISADVLKAGHHGSSTSTGSAFLRAAAPSYAVISCGKDNDYGHPHGEVIARLEEAGVQILRTDQQGSILAVSDGKTISWSVGTELVARDAEPESNAVTYVLNHNTKKFHYISCKNVNDIKEKNREDTALSREEIMDLGYEPCKVCRP